LFYHPEPRRLFIGLETGNILVSKKQRAFSFQDLAWINIFFIQFKEFAVGEDYNKITLIKQYLAHQAKVTSVFYSLEHDWVLSTSKDKYFAFHSTDNARRVGAYGTGCPANCLV
jgi:hypothetical protein